MRKIKGFLIIGIITKFELLKKSSNYSSFQKYSISEIKIYYETKISIIDGQSLSDCNFTTNNLQWRILKYIW